MVEKNRIWVLLPCRQPSIFLVEGGTFSLQNDSIYNVGTRMGTIKNKMAEVSKVF